MWTHWVARSNHPYEPFRDLLNARDSWLLLRKLFPGMLTAMLMPNHLHLLLSQTLEDPEVKRRLDVWKGAVSKRVSVRNLWQPGTGPQLIPDHLHLRRMVRYIALNPSRKNLSLDPLEWYWSTYRELLGATPDRAVSPEVLARAMRQDSTGFLKRLHKYVSSDESVQPQGTMLPIPALPTQWGRYSLQDILMASSGALRLPAEAVRREGSARHLFLQVATRYNWYRPATLAEICQVTERSVRRLSKLAVAPQELAAAELCLGDERLRTFRFAPLCPDFGNIPRSGGVELVL